MIGKRKILKLDLKEGKRTEEEDVIAVDKPITIFVSGKYFVTLMASPKYLKELAIGHLLGEGVITALEGIERVSVKGMNVNLETKVEVEPTRSLKVISTACGASGDIELLSGPGALKPRLTEFKTEEILNAFKSLQLSSKVFRKTGGTHAAALFTRGKKTEILPRRRGET